MTTVVEGLAELVKGIRADRLPDEVVAETRLRVLDALGCALGGYESEPGLILRSVARDLGGNAESTVWGEARRTSCDRATAANSTMLRYLDFMDSHAGPDACHPCFNIPPCLAVAERVDASGLDLIAAIVAGYEIQIRFQDCCRVSSRGWASSTYLEFSVPLAVGRLLGLDTPRMADAVGISASHANTLGALSLGSIPACKSSADGMTSATGVLAALMAERGLDGPHDVVESDGGFARAVAERLDAERLVAPIDGYRIMEVNTKWFNTVRYAQTAVSGVFALLKEHGLTWRDVGALAIRIPTAEHASHVGIWDSQSRLRPENRDSANHSPIFSVAVAMVDGELGPAQYRDQKLHDPDVLSLVDRTSLAPDPSLDEHWPAAAVTRVVLQTKDGRSVDKTTLYPPGHHRNRIGDEEMREKFHRLAAPVLDEEKRDAVIDAVGRLEQLGSVRDLTRHLGG